MPANPSPTKQRAALAPRDANANPSLPSPNMLKHGKASVLPSTGGISPLKKRVVVPASVSGTKRPAEDMSSPGNKKKCIDENARLHRSRTSSPSTSSIFDTSAADGDASWATTTTEPDDRTAAGAGAGATDAPALLVPRPRGNMTREQAREKAEILRLRLGLASYKLRTGQTGIPLADLQPKPLPPRPSPRLQSSTQHARDDALAQHQNPKPNHSITSTSTSTPAPRPTHSDQPVQAGTVDEPQSHCRAMSSD
ncbi:hypothetical protein E4U55_001046 [Claviceps digitariae]|nr:hypothetical protein E4U55_001046 [Claviceps digitariae]